MTVRLSRINSELNYDGRGVGKCGGDGGVVPGGDLHDSPGGARRGWRARLWADIDWPRCRVTPGLSGEPLCLHIAYVR